MQNAKDTFYEVLRGRLAALNPERTIVVRGVSRPGVLVDENELQAAAALPDCFHVRWTTEDVEQHGAMPLIALGCEISYATAGAAVNGGLDRGRALATMDGELLTALRQHPRNALKTSYGGLAGGTAAAAMGTRVWWSDVTFGPLKVDRDRVTRTAVVKAMSYQEAGEL